MEGAPFCTLVVTDIVSGWTECVPMLLRDQSCARDAIREARARLPVPPRGLDVDNGSEFLSYLLFGNCQQEGVEMTRSRPFRRNDQCFIEQKNGPIVRRIVGYDRF